MSAPLPPTPTPTPPAAPVSAPAPSPADAAAAAASATPPPTLAAGAPAQPPLTPDPAAGPPAEGGTPLTYEQMQAELARVRHESAGYRVRNRELEPLAQAAQEAADAEKSELQRATERAQTLETELATSKLESERFALAAEHAISELLAQANGAAAPAAPPSSRPIQTLRPGASPTPPPVEDHSYPAAWSPTRRETN